MALMLPRIAITRTWSDSDVAQLTFEACDGVSVFTNEAFARRLRDIPDVSDVRPRKWWVGSTEVHIRFRYHDREYIVWEPNGDNSRGWIGPDDENAPHIPLDDLERALSRTYGADRAGRPAPKLTVREKSILKRPGEENQPV